MEDIQVMETPGRMEFRQNCRIEDVPLDHHQNGETAEHVDEQ